MSNHPTTHTPFVGRDVECAEIVRLLSGAECRLVTLVGPGGIGKTRLALEAKRQFSFPHGVHYVALQPLTSSDFMLSTIADALGFQFYAGGNAKQQLSDYLREKSLLLVLDNLDHLLDGVTLLSDILTAAPQVRILATSRQRLNLLEEWVLEVDGLSYPSHDTESDFEHYSAVSLFLQHARRAKVNFTLTDEQKPAIIRICRLVGGMPLGIELSATWVRALPCEQIANEIERSLDILETDTRNIEPRHRNLRATLDQSWQLLTDNERDVFKKLSVFRGTFTREAAEYIAGASLRTLTALLDKSLLRVNEHGRYDLQELLRQYASEKLAATPAEHEAACDRHCTFYADFMGQWKHNLFEITHKQTLEKILDDVDNVRVGIRWAIHRRKLTELDHFLQTFTYFLDTQDKYLEALEFLHLTADRLRETFDDGNEQQTRLLGFTLAWQTLFLHQLERVDEARQVVEESLTLLLPFGEGLEIYYAYKHLVELNFDDLAEMKQFGEAALKCARAIDFRCGIAAAAQLLSSPLAELGDYEKAERLLTESLTICQKDNYQIGEAWTFVHLSHVAYCQHNFVEAKRWAQQAFVIAESTDYRLTLEILFTSLGDIASNLGDYEAARLRYQARLGLAQERGNQSNISLALESIQLVEAKQAAQAASVPANPNGFSLTERELVVLRLIADGMTNREIADQQVLAISTVKWYINEIFSKLQVTTRTQAVARARTLGLLA